MKGLLVLVGYYMRHHRGKTAILVLSMSLIVFLPWTTYRLVNEYESRLLARARATPAVLGPRGNRFDLVFHSLYFRVQALEGVTMESLEEVRSSGLARPIPLHGMFTARGFPVIGTDVEYFRFRSLSVAQGSFFVTLGDCVLGSEAAEKLGLSAGDGLMSDPVNVFDIAGEYPLNMRVRGVLRESGTADDHAVFVDVRTAWVIQGLGHGHEDVTRLEDEGVILSRGDGEVVAGAALMHYMEITPENIGSFHFHGEPRHFPLTGIICVPRDAKAATILAGRHHDSRSPLQLVTPVEVVEELFGHIFRIKRFFDVNIGLVSLSTVLLLVLIFMLSQRLRQREMTTMFYLGCSRGMTWKLQACELALIFVSSVILAGIAAEVIVAYAPYWMAVLFASGG